MKTILADYLIQFKWAQSIVNKFMPGVMYQIGFSGRGPTALDIEPEPFVPTWFEKFIWSLYTLVIAEYIELEKERRTKIWSLVTRDI